MFICSVKIFRTVFSALIILALSAGKVPGQNYSIRSFTTKDGLSHNNIRSIVRDSTGFLWIGTWDGISRYDGYGFKNYYHIPGDTASIPYFSVLTLCIDGKDNLWVMTDSRELALYNRTDDNFITFRKPGGFSPEDVNNISTDRDGDLWIISSGALYRRDWQDGEWTRLRITSAGNHVPSSLKGHSYGLTKTGVNKIWVCGSDINEIEITGDQARILNSYPVKNSIFDKNPDFEFTKWFDFYESSQGERWLFSNTGLHKFNYRRSQFEEYRQPVEINDFEGNRTYVWSWWENGKTFFLNPGKQLLRRLEPEGPEMKEAIYCHNENQAWLSAISSKGQSLGMKQVICTPDYFHNYLSAYEQGKIPAIFSILKDGDGNIYAGTMGNNYILKYTTGDEVTSTGHITPELFESAGHVRQMVGVPGGIWLGYLGNLLNFYDYKTGTLQQHTPDDFSCRTLALNDDGNLFIGTNKLSLYHPISGKTDLLWKVPENALIYDLLVEKNGIVWAAMGNSLLLKYDTNSAKSDLFRVAPEHYHIEDICHGDDSTLWLALLGGGLCRFNPATEESAFYTTADGLSNNTTYSVLRDKSGYIWISTNQGISRLNPETGQFRIFGEADGLGITEFNADASFVAMDGEFFFGGMGGFVSFYPDSINLAEEINVHQELFITGLEVSGVVKNIAVPVDRTDTIIFDKGENNFHLTFSASDFVSSDKTLFRYRLSNINRSWIETDHHNRNINYSNLKPGWYTLDIQATNKNGEWSAAKKITIRINPYFYQTGFFLLLLFLLILAVLIASISLYIRDMKQKERLKHDELKLQSLRGQMNPHFIFNSLNSINYFISNNDRLSANRYIADFSRLVRTILSSLGNNYIPFETEVGSLRDYLNIEHLRFGDKFDFELKTEEIGDYNRTEVLPGLVQPFVENAIWHGVRALENRKGIIRIRFLPTNNDRIKCIVEDDGIGRRNSDERHKQADRHQSRGIDIVIERLQLISKIRGVSYDLEIDDLYPEKSETGTRVKIDLPVK